MDFLFISVESLSSMSSVMNNQISYFLSSGLEWIMFSSLNIKCVQIVLSSFSGVETDSECFKYKSV